MKAEGNVVAYDAAKALKSKAKGRDMDFTVADDTKIKGEVKRALRSKLAIKKNGRVSRSWVGGSAEWSSAPSIPAESMLSPFSSKFGDLIFCRKI
jgi:hypothetical protein